jgi:hypothetical protein
MYWTFDNKGVAHPIHPTELNRSITLIDSETKKTVTINALATSESHKTLGVMECPEGNYTEENKRIEKKIRGFAQRVATTKLTRFEANLYYFTTFIPSINYSLSIGTTSLDLCSKLQGIATQKFLSKMGYNRPNQPSR